jgi:hypothetical protein
MGEGRLIIETRLDFVNKNVGHGTFFLPGQSRSGTMCPVNLRTRLAQFTYNFLDVGKSPRPADCIFVLAGSQERKVFGVKMWRFGYAAQLILSVGRFEWRKFAELDLESDGGLESLASQAPLKKHHFFVRLDRQEVCCTPVRTGFLGTRTEARALAEHLRKMSVRSLLVVSSPVHLRRVALAFRRAFRKSGILLTFVAIPEKRSFDSSADRAQVWSEYWKYVVSRLLLL